MIRFHDPVSSAFLLLSIRFAVRRLSIRFAVRRLSIRFAIRRIGPCSGSRAAERRRRRLRRVVMSDCHSVAGAPSQHAWLKRAATVHWCSLPCRPSRVDAVPVDATVERSHVRYCFLKASGRRPDPSFGSHTTTPHTVTDDCVPQAMEPRSTLVVKRAAMSHCRSTSRTGAPANRSTGRTGAPERDPQTGA